MTTQHNMTPMTKAQTQARRQSVFWRIHLWAAFLASPFALMAALTGLLYVLTPQIEHTLYKHLDEVAMPQPNGAWPKRISLDDMVAAASTYAQQRPELAGMAVQSVITPELAHQTVRVVLAPHHHDQLKHQGNDHAGEHTRKQSDKQWVFFNPYTGQVQGHMAEADRFSYWSKRLHSSLLQGDGWRWMIELAASWLMVMLLTGVYLWATTAADAAQPAKGRAQWRRWHAWLGVTLSAMSLVMLSTGLTWSKYAGDTIRDLRNATGQSPPVAPKNLASHPHDAKTLMLSWQQAWVAAQVQAPMVSMQLMAPKGLNGVWKISNFDRSQPLKRFDLVLHAYSGQSLFWAGWQQQTAFSKATAIGIPFHRGEFGWWNQLLLAIFGLGVVFSLVSGWVMFFKRRRTGCLGLPPLAKGAWRAVPVGVWGVALGLCALLPVLAWSALCVAVVELAMCFM